MTEFGGGFELWRTKDGINWIPVTRDGFGNPFNYGGRTMVSTPEGLFLGTANPFSPKVPVKVGSSVVYIPNPDGGTEVWHGNLAHLDNPPKEARDAPIEIREKGEDIAVTGGGGFIGQPLVKRLLDQGNKLRVLVLPGHDASLATLPDHPRLRIIESSLNDPDSLQALVTGASIVIHLAGRVRDGDSPEQSMRQVNVQGTHKLLRACAAHAKLKQFLFGSSTAVYESQNEAEAWPIPETGGLRSNGGGHLEDYGLSKIGGENLVRWFANKHDFNFTILRIAMVYGPQHPDIKKLAKQLSQNPSFGLGPDGLLPRQYIHVDDVVRAFICSMKADEATNEVFTIAGSEAVSNLDIAKFARRLRGESTTADLNPDRTLNWRRYTFPYDTRKARKRLGFTADINMAEGLAEIVNQ